jgi:hypothetical protein
VTDYSSVPGSIAGLFQVTIRIPADLAPGLGRK